MSLPAVEQKHGIYRDKISQSQEKKSSSSHPIFKNIMRAFLILLLLSSLVIPGLAFPLIGTGVVYNPETFHPPSSWIEPALPSQAHNTSQTNNTQGLDNLPYEDIPEDLRPFIFVPHNIFGDDDRITADSSRYPEKAIGRVSYKKGDGNYYSCTGELVSREHIITNAHCVFDDITDEDGRVVSREISANWKNTFQFYPAFEDGKSYDSSTWKIIVYPNAYKDLAYEKYEQDWVIIQLAKAIGDYAGHLTLLDYKYSDYADFPEPVNLVGYSADRYLNSAGAHYECQIRGAVRYWFGKQVAHDCDSRKGSSGSALYITHSEDGEDTTYIVALHHAALVPQSDNYYYPSFSFGNANLACETHEAFLALEDLIANNPDPAGPYTKPRDSRKIIYIVLGSTGGAAALIYTSNYLYKDCKNKKKTQAILKQLKEDRIERQQPKRNRALRTTAV